MLSLSIPADDSYSLEKALKVIRIIQSLQIKPDTGNRENIQPVVLMEDELNAYIAYRIEADREEVMRELQLKLDKGNRIEGKVFIDLKGQNLPGFLRPEMNFYFSAYLDTGEGRARLKIKDLFLEKQRIQPVVLDLVILIASKIQNEEAVALGDWVELPLGIRSIQTEKGKAVFYFNDSPM